MHKFALVALMLAGSVALAACGHVTGPPATGANSSAPNAVDEAHGGVTGGGANAFNKQLPVVNGP